MPAFFGGFKVVSNGSGGIVHTGDLLVASPSSSTKTFSGAGSFLTGDLSMANVALNYTFVFDPDVADTNVNKMATGT